MRRRAGAIVAALVVGGVFSFIAPPAVHASAGGPMTAASGVFTGTAGDDLLVIAHDGNLLTHNRFAAGDPGFNSATDFDSTQSGDQTITVGNGGIGFSLGDGDDTVQLVGTFASVLNNSATKDMGPGTDTLDFANYSPSTGQGVQFGIYGAYPVNGLEKVIGTAFNDAFQMSYLGDAGVTVLGGAGDDSISGTTGNDDLEGGGGKDHIEAIQGDDTVVVSAPLPATRDYVYGMEGNDLLVIRGTGGADDLELARGGVITDSAHPDGGYGSSDFERYRIEAGGGDDTLDVDPVANTVVDGGTGNDSAFLNAYKSTASVQADGTDRLVALPIYAKRADRGNETTRLTGVERLSIYNETVIATAPGPGGGPHVRTFRADGTPVAGFMAYAPEFTGGVSVAVGDVDGDFDGEIITGPGPGGGPHVRVFRSDGTDTGVGFMAYAPTYTGGVNVATVDVDGDGVDEIVTVPASPGGPHVRVWSGDGHLLEEWMAPGFGNTGLFVARGPRFEQTQDEAEQLIVSSASGPSQVAVFERGGINGYTSFAPYPGFGGGASVARAEFDPYDPFALDDISNEIVTAAGPGGGPHVQVFNPDGSNYHAQNGFYAYDPNFHGGVGLATCNADGGDDEILTAAGPGGGPHVRMFTKTGAPLPLSFMAYDPNFHGGVRVACGGAETKQY
ncbi:MAG: trimeric autotransporter adhesin [Actinomycetota bacterium]